MKILAPNIVFNSWLRSLFIVFFLLNYTSGKRNCSSNICFNGGLCTVDDSGDDSGDDSEGYRCECRPGFSGTLCELPIPCSLECRNDGFCTFNSENNQICECPEGFAGDLCAATADCLVTGCLEGEICLLDSKDQKWSCAVDVCFRDNPCRNNVTCRPIRNGFVCECPVGLSGRTCEIDVDECGDDPCRNGAECVNMPGGFRCVCSPGFNGQLCEQHVGFCVQDPCGPRGDCIELNQSYSCNCHPGFSGKNCEKEVPICVCENERHECSLVDGRAVCKCPEGTQGENCDQPVDLCVDENPCQNGGQCIANGNQIFCICSSQFTGQFCQNKIVECLVDEKPCLNGGKCVKGESNNSVDNKCECVGRFMGKWCEQLRLNAHLNSSSPSRQECPSGYCGNGGKCKIENGKPTCSCPANFAGSRCERLLSKDLCSPDPCLNDGQCQTDGKSVTCFCTEDFTGKHCEIPCRCDSGDICRESLKTPGSAECLTVPPSEILIPDNVSEPPVTMRTIIPKLETTQKPLTTNFPTPPSLVTEKQTESFSLSSLTSVHPNKLTTTPVPPLELGPFDGLLNVTSCDDCINAHRCLEIDRRFVCLCQPDFTGAYCDEPITSCSSMTCENGQVCRLQRSGSSDLAQCACAPGFFGVNCKEPTTAGFRNTSVLLYQTPEVSGENKNKKNEYSLIFSFKTTLSKVHFVSGEDLLGRRKFSIELIDGFLVLTLAEEKITILELLLNDEEWYSVWLTISGNLLSVEIEDSGSSYILTRNKQKIKPFVVFTTRFGKIDEKRFFVGCLRDAFVDGEIVDLLSDERSIDIDHGCNRKDQCSVGKCQNGAACVDLWNDFRCDCVRPFLEPTCVEKLQEVTFGHDNVSSLIEYSIDPEDSRDIRQKFDFSFLLKTNAKNGIVAFLGNRSDNEDSVSTFIGTEIKEGKLAVSGRLGGKRVLTVTTDKKINDNGLHLIEIQRTGNDFRIKIDGKQEGILQFKQPFEHPLLADSLIFGDRSSIKESFLNNSSFFKGVIQDVRINARSVLLIEDHLDFEIETFGQKLLDQNILPGTVSDDVCAVMKPCLQGRCFNTFNDFECQCDPGWIGRDCGKKNFCSNKPCPENSECRNSHGGYVCISAATFSPTSVIKYSLSLPEGLIERKMEANFSLEVRTRSTNGQVFKMQSSTDSISLQLSENGINFIYSNATNSMRDPLAVNLSNGDWHTVVVRESSGKLFVEFDSSPSAPLLAPFSLTKFLIDKNGRFLLGKGYNTTGFKGCVQNVLFSNFPQLSFLPEEVFSGGLKSVSHFIPVQRENLKSDGCTSREVCGALNPCKNGATCVDMFNLRECRCLAGFEGEFCEMNIDDCGPDKDDKCNYSGTCVDGVNEWSCSCLKGFSGDYCETLLDQCKDNPCQNGGVCETEPDATYSCSCRDGFFGIRCQQRKSVRCDARPCENGGTCRETDDGIECICPPLYKGPLCEDFTNPCAIMPCQNGGTCSVQSNGMYKCDCLPLYSGDTCAEFAETCLIGLDSDNPLCVHGACRNIWNGYLCQCDQGWTGNRCEIDLDECLDFPCENNGTCVNIAGGFRCDCAEFYLGNYCEVVGICATKPCLHGKCVQHSASDFTCNCEKGYQGKNCEEQIDYCKDEPCMNGATCQKLIGGFKCLCIAGFTGETCATDIDDCVAGACANGGRCVDRVNGFECNCNSTGFKGAQCTEDIDECSSQLISNYCINGLCVNSPGSYKCQCEEGYIGKRCNMVDPCVPDVLNRTLHNCVHGICRNPVVVVLPGEREVAQHDCECFSGFTGPQCTHQIEKHYAIALGYIVGPLAAILIVLCLLGCMLFVFVAKNKRANQGHYSPSNQEQTGNRMQNFSDVFDGSSKTPIASGQQAPPRTPDIKLKIRPAPEPPISRKINQEPPINRKVNQEPPARGTTWAFAVHPIDEML